MQQQTAVPSLPFEKLMECTHCGLCLPFCPTYRELGTEMDSPRGRIYIVRALMENRVEATARLTRHVELCVGCRACETACPSGVSFGMILEHARHMLGQSRSRIPIMDRLLYRYALLRKERLVGLGRLLEMYRGSPLRRITKLMGVRGILPSNLERASDILTAVAVKPWEPADQYAAEGTPHLRVGLLICCMMRTLLTGVNDATIRVLTKGGCEVVVPQKQECCGALHAHAGHLETARRLARTNIMAFEEADVNVIVTNSAGCGAHMKEYEQLLEGDEPWADRARAFSSKVRDVSEVLNSLDISTQLEPLPLKVAYDDPCHLLHGQGIRKEPRSLLRRIPGLELVELEESDWCCGSAGTYMFAEPEMASRLLDRKLDAIRRSGASLVATGNPGCLLWIAWGLRQNGIEASCVHPVQLIDLALP